MSELLYWHWFIIGVVLLILEIFAPGAILMWFGFGGLLTGVLLWLFPAMDASIQFLIFALFSGISVIAWRFYHKKVPNEATDTPDLNNRLQAYVGTDVTLTTAIKNGRGQARVGDTAWKVKGKDMPAGTKVRIVTVEGMMFYVEKTL